MTHTTAARSSAEADTIANVRANVSADATADATGDTIAATDAPAPSAHASFQPAAVTRGTTVFPRVEAHEGKVRLVHEERARYATERQLGEGGMGTVDLATDQDIERRVAVKRLRREARGETSLARFVQEVRTVAQLEHPNIVPVHDVGLDEQGYFLVMKYVEGETVERIIERLAAGDAEAHRQYTVEARVAIFIGLLRALAYAHDRGIVHRDVKPANVMVGPYGEVVLMDWGIARPIDGVDLPAQAPVAGEDHADEQATSKRLVQTQGAALVGTPMYMSPEQARGARDLDARSDLYAACVLFHELLTLRHYLADKQSIQGVLVGVMTQELPGAMSFGAWAHPKQSAPPMEHVHFVRRGMDKDRAARWQSAEEMIAALEDALAGKVRVQCPLTASKRCARETGRFIDRHPRTTAVGVSLGALGVVLGIASAVVMLVS